MVQNSKKQLSDRTSPRDATRTRDLSQKGFSGDRAYWTPQFRLHFLKLLGSSLVGEVRIVIHNSRKDYN